MKVRAGLLLLFASAASAHGGDELGSPPIPYMSPVGGAATASPPRQQPGQRLPLKPTRKIAFDTDEGSWMSLALSPDGKRIAFDLLGDLYLLDSGGGKARRISSGLAFDAQPVFSPNGASIAFISDRSGAENIWTARADGSGARQLTFSDDDTPLISPAWSVDGKAVFVSRYRADLNGFELWRHDLSGGSELIIPVKAKPDQDRDSYTSALGAAPSPDGHYLYYAGHSGKIEFESVPEWTIRRRDLRTGQEQVIVEEPQTPRKSLHPGAFFRPAISPDGQWLAYATRFDGKTGLRLRNLTTAADRWLAYPIQHDQAQASPWQDIVPRYAFTPDGKAILLSRDGRIERIDIASGRASPITFSARVEAVLGPLTRVAIAQETGPVRARIIQTPEASPDGRQLAFSALGHVYVMPLEKGGTPHRLTSGAQPEYQPSWSPDGRSIVYVSWTAKDAGNVWVASADDSTPPRKVSDQPDYYTNPTFTPDGRAIIALRSSQTARLRTYMEFGNQREASLVVLGEGAPRTVLSAKMGGKPHFGPNPGEVYLQFADGLNAVDLATGARRRVLSVVGPGWYFQEGAVPVDDLRLSPDGKWALAQIAQQLHLVAVPGGKEPVVVDLSIPASTHRKLTDVGADFFGWEDGGRTIDWTVGSTFHRRPLGDGITESFPAKVEVPRDTPHGTLLLRGARVLTMAGDATIEGADILIRDDRIAAIGPRGSITLPEGVTIRDIAGKTVIPGLIDNHDHVADIRRDVLDMQPWGLRARLAYGITTAFDPSSLSIDMLAYEDLIDAGLAVGSRLHSTGPALFSFNRFGSLDEVRAVLSRYRDHYRTRSIKEYRTGNRRVRQWVAMAAHEMGMLPTTEGALAMKLDLSQIADGFSGSEHAFVVAPLSKDVVTFVAKSKTSYTTTLQITNGGPPGQDYFIATDNPHGDPKYNRFTPHFAIDQMTRHREWRLPSDYFFADVAAGAAAIQRAGGVVGMGAHGEMPGLDLHWEMEAHVMGGMKPIEALRAATIGAAETIGRAAEFGSIEPGKYADLVILDADPREDIRNARAVSAVMKDGRLYDGATLDQIWPRQAPLPRPWFADDQPPGL
jgi:Tol biopolymer transport system component